MISENCAWFNINFLPCTSFPNELLWFNLINYFILKTIQYLREVVCEIIIYSCSTNCSYILWISLYPELIWNRLKMISCDHSHVCSEVYRLFLLKRITGYWTCIFNIDIQMVTLFFPEWIYENFLHSFPYRIECFKGKDETFAKLSESLISWKNLWSFLQNLC